MMEGGELTKISCSVYVKAKISQQLPQKYAVFTPNPCPSVQRPVSRPCSAIMAAVMDDTLHLVVLLEHACFSGYHELVNGNMIP